MNADDKPWITGARFGSADTPLPDNTTAPDEPDPDDEELDETPPDVIAMLGFDPKEGKSEKPKRQSVHVHIHADE